VRAGIGRNSYMVDPGLYALGQPDTDSPVLISANYKMSFDNLREALPGRNAWILVLDTNGINVWCAAGKGTFGTDELVGRIEECGLRSLVNHRRVIVPQLGAAGISAHEAQRLSGFKITYGPIRAADLPEFMDSDHKARPEMREKTFSTTERLALVPVELVHALKTLFFIFPSLLILGGLAGTDGLRASVALGLLDTAGLMFGILAGCVITPLLLPWLPGRAFAAKGIPPGIACALLFLFLFLPAASEIKLGALATSAWLLIIPAVSAYLAMNFTGCSTFTSLSGVKNEMRIAVPVEIGAVAAGVILLAVSRFLF